MKISMRIKNNGGSYQTLQNDEAEIGLLSGREIEDIRPYLNKKPSVTCFNNALIDKRRLGAKQSIENDDVSSTMSPLWKKRDKRDDIGSVSSYTKMKNNEDGERTIETSDCSVSLLSNPTLSDNHKVGGNQISKIGGKDLMTCCVQNLAKMKEKMEDDVTLNPLSPTRIQSLSFKQSSKSNDEGSRSDTYDTVRPKSLHKSEKSNNNGVQAQGGLSVSAPSPYSQKMRSFLFDDAHQKYDELRDNTKEVRDPPPIDSFMINDRKLSTKKMYVNSTSKGQNQEETMEVKSPARKNLKNQKKLKSQNNNKSKSSSSFEEIIGLIGVASSESSTTNSPKSKNNNQNDQESSLSFSFEENTPEDQEQSYHEMSPEEKAKIVANIAELNKKFYARRGNLSNLEREKKRRQKIKWWDDERSVISRVASSVYGDSGRKNMSCIEGDSSVYNSVMNKIFCFFDVVSEADIPCEGQQSRNNDIENNDSDDDDGDEDEDEDEDDGSTDEENEENDENHQSGVDDDDTVDLSNGIDGVDDDDTVDLTNGIDGVLSASSSNDDDDE